MRFETKWKTFWNQATVISFQCKISGFRKNICDDKRGVVLKDFSYSVKWRLRNYRNHEHIKFKCDFHFFFKCSTARCSCTVRNWLCSTAVAWHEIELRRKHRFILPFIIITIGKVIYPKYTMVFCYQNCSDLRWEKIVLVI